MRVVAAIGALAGLLVACGASSERVRGPDGGWWWDIECRHSQTECIEEAGDDCPHGYKVADSEGGESGAVAYTTGSTTFVKSKYRGHMLIKCKRSSD